LEAIAKKDGNDSITEQTEDLNIGKDGANPKPRFLDDIAKPYFKITPPQNPRITGQIQTFSSENRKKHWRKLVVQNIQ